MTKTTPARAGSAWKDWALALLCLAVVLGFLFRQSFEERMVLFSNDAPLGLISSNAGVTASTWEGIISGFWQDLNWIGMEMPSVLPGLSWGMFQIWGTPVLNAKLHTPVSLFFLGFCAWYFFRTLGFRNVVCILGGLAAALNTDPFSHGTWGLPSRALTMAATFLALAGLYSGLKGRAWIKAALAGMCVGMGIMEGFDVGALYSLYVAAFGLFLALTHPKNEEDARKPAKLLAIGVVRVAIVAIAAGLFAAQALTMLIGTQIKGVAGMEQDTKSKEERWTEATQWSLPKVETVRVIIPGLFGYRMDTPNGGNYWGAVGQAGSFPRHSGAGEYAGVIVILVGIVGAANAFRKKGNLYNTGERRIVLFWTGAGIVSVLFAWGHWAPFYRMLYALPFFSTIRNPIKFMHFFQLSIIILFGYGLELLFRHYLATAAAKAAGPREQFKKWWAVATEFERKVVLGFCAGLGASLVGFLVYASSRPNLEKALASEFQAPLPTEIASFSLHEFGIYLVFYAIALGVILLCFCGFFSGPRVRFAGWLLGAVLLIDLCRANLPWIVYYDYKEKYVSNDVLDFLRKDPVDHRVTMKVAPFSQAYLLSQQLNMMQGVFGEWLQHHFQYFNIQALDIIQMPRPPVLDSNYRAAFIPSNQDLFKCARLWELSNTRYILGQREYLGELNQRFDPGRGRFRIATNFDFAIKPGLAPNAQVGLSDVTWVFKPDGKLAIFEFTGALPRYGLYANWQVTDDTNALATLASAEFDPARLVLVDDETMKSSSGGTTNAGTVKVVSYEPKKIVLKAEASAPSILLWNDRWSANWHATVDGKPVKLLRCNYIMRGIETPAGAHEIVMHYAQPAQMLWVSFGTLGVGVLMLGFLAVDARRRR